jgi:hypothetical protein
MSDPTLSPQTFGDILATLRGAREGGGQELRRSARVRVEARVMVATWVDDTPQLALTVLTRDLSMTGIGFLTGQGFSKNNEIAVLLPRAKGQYVGVVARVVYIRQIATDVQLAGAAFAQVLSPGRTADLAKLFLGTHLTMVGSNYVEGDVVAPSLPPKPGGQLTAVAAALNAAGEKA